MYNNCDKTAEKCQIPANMKDDHWTMPPFLHMFMIDSYIQMCVNQKLYIYIYIYMRVNICEYRWLYVSAWTIHVSIVDLREYACAHVHAPQKLRFAVFRHKNVVFAVFFAWWVAAAVRKTSNSRDLCNHTLWSRHGSQHWLVLLL